MKQEPPPFRVLFTLAIGLGFGTTAITWTFFNGNMIAFLESNFQPRYPWMTNAFLGFVMTWDNIIAIFVQPWIGAKSDNTKTRFGRRTPYVLVGVPLAAIFFAIIPLTASSSIVVLILVVLAFNMSMAIYRSPVVALMPDLTHEAHRSKANGIINLMGGVFAGIALFLGGFLVKEFGFTLGFQAMSVVMLITFAAFLLLVRESKELEKADYMKAEEEVSLRGEIRSLISNPDKSLLLILFGIVSWFIAWNALEVWIPPYIAVNVLGVSDTTSQAYVEAIGQANNAIGLVPIIFVLSTLPAGYIGTRFGQKRTILTGIVLFIVGMVYGATFVSLSATRIAFMIAAVAWALINVNSIVIVWGLSDNIGGATGLYYLASSLAAITGPILFGALRDLTGTLYSIWWFSLVFLLLAAVIMLPVRYAPSSSEGS